jgi:hypothetical protein
LSVHDLDFHLLIYLRKTFNIALCVGCKFKIISILENIGVHIAAINQIIKDENEK